MTKKLSSSALLAALATIALCAGAWLPRGGLALTALAAVFLAAIVIECGCAWAALGYAVTGLLGFLLCADKTLPLWFALVFGPYPIWKHLLEQLTPALLRWALKIAAFFASLMLLYFLFSSAFSTALPAYPWYVLMAGLCVVFILFDIGFSRLLGLYLRRVHRAV